MAINFPSSPADGQIFVDTTTGLRYVYVASGSYWRSNGTSILGNSVSPQVIFNDSGLANGTNGIVYVRSSNTLYANTVNVTGYIYGNGAFLTGVSTSTESLGPAFNQANSAYAQANLVFNVANAAFEKANTGVGGAAFDTANAAFDKANSANLLAFNTGVGANAYASGVGANANSFASATIAGANTAVGAGANAYANLVWSRSNTYAATVGTSANAFTSATIAGANTAVGTGANAFTSATIAGANTAVGTGANAFATSATIAANNYAGVMANAANAFMINVQNGSNTAVGTGANAFASATIAGANAAVGAGANTVGSAAFLQANTARTQANTAYTVANAAFDKANTSSGGSVGPAFDAANAAFATANAGTTGTAAVRTGNTAPTGVIANTLWWNTETGRLLIYYQDVDSAQWVEATPDGVVGPAGLNASITVATATIVPPDQLPSVINTGNTIFANLSFSLPRAYNVYIQPTATVLLPSQNPTVTNSGNTTDFNLTFSLPRAYTVAVNNTISIPFQNPAVINNAPTANTTDLKLDFYIPRGNTGQVGPKSITIPYPAAGEDFTIFYNYDRARTLSRVSTVLVPVGAATGPNVTFTIRYATTRNAVGTEILTGGMVANTITGAGAGSNVTTFTNATIPVNNWVWLETSNATSNTYTFTVSMDFTDQ